MTSLRALLVPFWLAFEALAVGETCPASVDVEARVRAILHLSPEQTLSESFLVERHESGLYVELRSSDTAVIGQRTLPAAGSCDELAQASAVVLAAWLTDVHPDFAGALPAPPPEQPAEPKAEEPSPEEPKPASSGASLKSAEHPPPPLPPPPPKRYLWDFALGVGADYAAGELALAGYVSAGLAPESGGLGLGLMAIPSASRERALGPGNFEWRRWPLGLGPTWRLVSPSVVVDVSAGAALAWLHFSGSVFDRTFQPNGAAWGGFLSLRASTQGRHWGALWWLEGQYYPAESKVYASGVDAQWVLPKTSLGAFVGVRFSP